MAAKKGTTPAKAPAKPARNEHTSAEIASIASRGMRGEKLTAEEVRRVSATAMTQARDKAKGS